MSGGVNSADSSAAAWRGAAVAEAEAYAEAQADLAAAERDRREADAAGSQTRDGFDRPPLRSSGSGPDDGSGGPTVGKDGKVLSPGERTFFVKVPPEDVNSYLEGGYPVVQDDSGGWFLDTRSTAEHVFIEKAPPPTHWLPDYAGTVHSAGGASSPDEPPWPPPPARDLPIQPTLLQADDLSPKGLFKLGAAILVGIGKLLGKEAAEKILKEGVERVGKEALNPQQTANLARFDSKLPAGAGPTAIYDVPGGGRVFQAEVPGRVPGSKAIYEKHVGASGETLHFTKTTIDPAGNVVHTKDKVTGEVVPP